MCRRPAGSVSIGSASGRANGCSAEVRDSWCRRPGGHGFKCRSQMRRPIRHRDVNKCRVRDAVRRAFLADIHVAGFGDANGDLVALQQGEDICGLMDAGLSRQLMVNQLIGVRTRRWVQTGRHRSSGSLSATCARGSAEYELRLVAALPRVTDKLSETVGKVWARGGDNTECPRWDSNPHWTGFESVSSASWDTRAYSASYLRGSLPP